MRETETADPGQNLRQGDILKIVDPDKDHNLGCIINADCDLENGKVDGAIAYLPIFSFHQFLDKFWSVTFLHNEKQAVLRQIRDILEFSDTDLDELIMWLREEGAGPISERLANVGELGKKEAEKLFAALQRLSRLLKQPLPNFQSIKEICKNEGRTEVQIRKIVKGAKQSLAGSHVFVNEIQGESQIGFAIRMRRIHSLPEAHSFKSLADSKFRNELTAPYGYRIASFTSLIRFKVIHHFVQQYSRIGLPDDLHALEELAVEEAVAELAK